MPYIRLKNRNYIVHSKYLFSFLNWWLQYHSGGWSKVKTLLSFPLLIRLNNVWTAPISKEEILSITDQISWIRWKRDQSKMQIFKLKGQSVYKIQLDGNQEQFEKELSIIKEVYPLTPRLKKINTEKQYWVEPLLARNSDIAKTPKWSQLFERFSKQLYQPYSIKSKLYLMTMPNAYQNALTKAFEQCEIDSLVLSRVHGDVWYNNIVYNKRQLVLIDWEYTRIASLSYDLWHCLFMDYYKEERDLGEDFFSELGEILKTVYKQLDVPLELAKAFHLLHLTEKIKLYKAFNSAIYINDLYRLDQLFFNSIDQ